MSWRVANGSSHSQTGRPARTARDADPAVDPQEQRRDRAVGRPAGDALDDDPRPADQADARSTIRTAPARGRRGPSAIGGAPDVAREHEHERERDGRRGPDEVDGQRQRALVDRRTGRGPTRRPARRGWRRARARAPRGGDGRVPRPAGGSPPVRRASLRPAIASTRIALCRAASAQHERGHATDEEEADDDRQQDVACRGGARPRGRPTAPGSARRVPRARA